MLDPHLGAALMEQQGKTMTLRGHLAHFAARRQDQPDLKHSSETLAQPVSRPPKREAPHLLQGYLLLDTNQYFLTPHLQSKPINFH